MFSHYSKEYPSGAENPTENVDLRKKKELQSKIITSRRSGMEWNSDDCAKSSENVNPEDQERPNVQSADH